MTDTGHAQEYDKRAERYARRAAKDTQGRRHCAWVRLAARRFLDDLKRARRRTCWFTYDPWYANDVCDFIEKLPHVEGQWDDATIRLEDWQVFILANVFGFRRKSDDGRRFNTAYVEVARKNAKSTLSAGVGLYTLCCEGEPGAQVKSAATTGDQARIVWGVARKMVQATPALREAFGLEPWANSLTCAENGGTFQPINAKSSTQDGLNPHCSIVDELHAHRDRGLFDVLKSARGARRNPLSWYITTAGYDVHGVCYEQRRFVTKALEGVFSQDQADHYFGVVYTLDEGDDPFGEQGWIKANPNLDVSVYRHELRQVAEEAKLSPESEGEFKTKRCNVWLSAASAWLNMHQWDRCEHNFTLDDFAGCPAWIGADLADKDDIADLSVVFERDDVVYAVCWHYLPRELVQSLAERKGAHYRTWADQGVITLTDGDFIDHRQIEDDIAALCAQFEVRGIAFDQYGGANVMASRLVEQGRDAKLVPKNAKQYTDPAKDLEARLSVGKFAHTGDPCLKWMASNVVVYRGVDGSLLPKKESAQSPHKIDGIDAICMANKLRIDDHGRPTESVYQRRAPISLPT